MKQFRKIKPRFLVLVIILLLFFSLFVYSKGSQQVTIVQHVSEDLKISFSYPKGWFVDEKNQSILVASYETHIGQNSRPNNYQIKIFIDTFSSCFPTIEQDLMYPACGERKIDGPDEILDKESRETTHGTYYKYVTKTPSGQVHTYNLLESGDKILHISKEPDPSKFEKEFEEIINSIRFL